MITPLEAAATFAIAWFAAVVLTPMVAQLAIRLGAVDAPDGRRKSQSVAVPRGGGVAVAVATVVALVVAALWTPFDERASSAWLVRGLPPSITVLLIVGVIDDFFSLTGIYKLIGQVLAVSVLVAAGAQFDQISVFGLLIPLGDFGIPFTMFFCLGAINAFNLIDGADGLASSIGAIVATTLGVITAAQGHTAASIACFALAGGLVGFLRFNSPPAQIYLGDTGSMLIGLMVAAVAIECSIKQQAAFVLSVPIAICAIPILDAGAALVRRVTTGQSVFAADRGHLHHALLLRGWSVEQTVTFISALATLTSVAALVSFFTNNDAYALVATAGVFLSLAGSRMFGHTEVRLIASRLRGLLRRMVWRRRRQAAPAIESALQFQGTREWQNLWSALRETLPLYNVAGITLQISIPQIHESFFATWKGSESPADDDPWRLAVPLLLDGQPVGRLSVVGCHRSEDPLDDLQRLIDYLDSLEGEIAHIVAADAATERDFAAVDVAAAVSSAQ